MYKRHIFSTAALITLGLGTAMARSGGPDPRKTGAPGDEPLACTQCHAGALNSGPGSVKIVLENGPVYAPGVKQRIVVQVSDPDQRRWGFQLTARLSSDPAKAQAGDFSPVDDNTKVICENGAAKPCPANAPVQFIEHTSAGTRNGTTGGVKFEFEWTPPADGQGQVTMYVAGNAANGNGNTQGDRIYTSSVTLSPASSSGGSGQETISVTKYTLKRLVSDVAGLADQTDPNLVNPWGIALGPNTAFWISNAGAGNSTLYNGAGQPFPVAAPLVVAVPGSGGSPAHPTGQVYNGTTAFELQTGKPAVFIFATEAGTILGWNRDVDPANAIAMADNSSSGASYRGLALGYNSSGYMLYAANFGASTIDVFDSALKQVTLSGGFKDASMPEGFAPFNILRVGRSLYVTYAKRDPQSGDDVPGAGEGYVNVFDMDGNLRKRFISGGVLNAPWGLAIAPGFFGDYSNTLLVGNFGDGTINAFDLLTGDFLGALRDPNGEPIVIEGLWGLQFGNGKANGGDANTLYFAAGISNGGKVEDHGLFGSIQVAPAN